MTDSETVRKHSGFEMTGKLIECVKKHPYLYDAKDDSYKNVAMKSRVWEQIGKEINETGEIAKTKWKSLRDNYGRYKKEMADPTIQVKKFLRWPWATQLQFLDATTVEREKNPRHSSRSDTPPPQQFLEISLTEQEIEGTSRDTNYTDTSPPMSPQPEAIEEYIHRPKRIKRESNIPERSQELDAIGHLFKSYAQTFKTFSKRNQIALKVELAQLFADIEAKEIIENNQVK